MKTKKLTQEQATAEIDAIADKAGLRVLIIGKDNFSEACTGKRFTKAEKERLIHIFAESLCDIWEDKKLEAIDFIKKYS